MLPQQRPNDVCAMKRKWVWAPWLVIFMASCSGSVEYEIVTRKMDVNGKLEAVLVKYNYGATVDYVYRLYLCGADEHCDFTKTDDAFLVADHVEGMSVIWINDKMVSINYDKARIFKYSNFSRKNDQLYEIRLNALGAYSL